MNSLETSITTIEVGDINLQYKRDLHSGAIGLSLVPAGMASAVRARRGRVEETEVMRLGDLMRPPLAEEIDSLVHLHLSGDGGPSGYAQGRTMRNGRSTTELRYVSQQCFEEGEAIRIITVLESNRCKVLHRVHWHRGSPGVWIETELENTSSVPIVLEMLSSFSLGGLTPFAENDAPNRLIAHRLRTSWSAEARLVSESIENLHLERGWQGHSVNVERFGQVGTMPARGFFPFVAVEDQLAGVVWGAQLAWAGSWQMELYRKGDALAVSGGLADREFGHWRKTLAPGERIHSPAALVSVVHGDLDDVCHRLIGTLESRIPAPPPTENSLPLICNEFCTSWGNPMPVSLNELGARVREVGVEYLVIDAGWYAPPGAKWFSAHGDWQIHNQRFPSGLRAAAADIRQLGLTPGLWFEIETCGEDASAFSLVDHFVELDGVPITVGARRFWDFNDAWVIDYLEERVIGLLRECGFGYVKIDYNETLGIGCDHADSPGEGLRQQVLAVMRFLERLRRQLPHLVIELCSSGGHRIEASMLALSAMVSFSDAHENIELPVIAANLHRVAPPRQIQIWAVLRREDAARRLIYSLAAGFLGRLCLSGDLVDLNELQWNIVKSASTLYREAAPLIQRGISRRFGPAPSSYRQLAGWQAMLRVNSRRDRAMVVIHRFTESGGSIRVELPYLAGGWRITHMLADQPLKPSFDGRDLLVPLQEMQSACVILLSPSKNDPQLINFSCLEDGTVKIPS